MREKNDGGREEMRRKEKRGEEEKRMATGRAGRSRISIRSLFFHSTLLYSTTASPYL